MTWRLLDFYNSCILVYAIMFLPILKVASIDPACRRAVLSSSVILSGVHSFILRTCLFVTLVHSGCVSHTALLDQLGAISKPEFPADGTIVVPLPPLYPPSYPLDVIAELDPPSDIFPPPTGPRKPHTLDTQHTHNTHSRARGVLPTDDCEWHSHEIAI